MIDKERGDGDGLWLIIKRGDGDDDDDFGSKWYPSANHLNITHTRFVSR